MNKKDLTSIFLSLIFFFCHQNVCAFFSEENFPGVEKIKNKFRNIDKLETVNIDYSLLMDLDVQEKYLDENGLITKDFLNNCQQFKQKINLKNPKIEEKKRSTFQGSYTQKLFIIKSENGDPRFIVKVPKGNEDFVFSDDVKIQQEISNLQQVMKNDRFNKNSLFQNDNIILKLAIPTAIFTYKIKADLDKNFYFELIPFAEGIDFLSLNRKSPKKTNEALSLIATALATFHKISQRQLANGKKDFVNNKNYSQSGKTQQYPPNSIQMGDFQPTNIFVDLQKKIVTISDLETLGENIKKSKFSNLFWQEAGINDQNTNDLETIINGYDKEDGDNSIIAKWGLTKEQKTTFKEKYFQELQKN